MDKRIFFSLFIAETIDFRIIVWRNSNFWRNSSFQEKPNQVGKVPKFQGWGVWQVPPGMEIPEKGVGGEGRD